LEDSWGVDLLSEFEVAEVTRKWLVGLFVGSVSGKDGFEAGVEQVATKIITVGRVAFFDEDEGTISVSNFIEL